MEHRPQKENPSHFCFFHSSPLMGGDKGEGVIVKYRNIKYPRLEFKTGRLNLVLPKGMHAQDVINRHHHWISEKSNLIKKYLKQSNHLKIIYRSDNGFKKVIDSSIQIYSKALAVSVNQIFFRKMHTKWASCSPRHNIMVNTLMKYLPKKHIEYIIYHELIHLVEKRHNEYFWKLLERKYKNHNKLEKNLFSYWFLLMSKD